MWADKCRILGEIDLGWYCLDVALAGCKYLWTSELNSYTGIAYNPCG